MINSISGKIFKKEPTTLYIENNGIVFLDEIDKVSARGDRIGGDAWDEIVEKIASSPRI